MKKINIGDYVHWDIAPKYHGIVITKTMCEHSRYYELRIFADDPIYRCNYCIGEMNRWIKINPPHKAEKGENT